MINVLYITEYIIKVYTKNKMRSRPERKKNKITHKLISLKILSGKNINSKNQMIQNAISAVVF